MLFAKYPIPYSRLYGLETVFSFAFDALAKILKVFCNTNINQEVTWQYNPFFLNLQY